MRGLRRSIALILLLGTILMLALHGILMRALPPNIAAILLQTMILMPYREHTMRGKKSPKHGLVVVERRTTMGRLRMVGKTSMAGLCHHRSARDTKQQRNTSMQIYETGNEREITILGNMKMIDMRRIERVPSTSTLDAQASREVLILGMTRTILSMLHRPQEVMDARLHHQADTHLMLSLRSGSMHSQMRRSPIPDGQRLQLRTADLKAHPGLSMAARTLILARVTLLMVEILHALPKATSSLLSLDRELVVMRLLLLELDVAIHHLQLDWLLECTRCPSQLGITAVQHYL
jgi:hypothetical protein